MSFIPIEISARHIHLSAVDWSALFGQSEITIARTLSQPPQFIAIERLSLSGPGGKINNVGIVGPLRPYTQVELAASDARQLGIVAPLSASGHLDQAGEITFLGPNGTITRPAAIIQQRHIHASPAQAAKNDLTDHQIVSVRVDGPRGGVFNNVMVRVDTLFEWQMHIDTDEANAFGPGTKFLGEIILN